MAIAAAVLAAPFAPSAAEKSPAAYAFILVLTFAAPTRGGLGHVETKEIRCPDWKCVELFEAWAPFSTTLQRFDVYERGRDGRLSVGGQAIFPPLLSWRPA